MRSGRLHWIEGDASGMSGGLDRPNMRTCMESTAGLSGVLVSGDISQNGIPWGTMAFPVSKLIRVLALNAVSFN